MTDKALHKKDSEKFLFHMNIFDEEVGEDVAEEPLPPPPTFSEEEMAEAVKSGYEKGKADGFAEAKKAEQESRDALIARTLERISDETATLFVQEQERAKRYEHEAAALSLELFEKLFPIYQEKHGFKELKASITEILEKQQNQIEIQIYVQPDVQAPVEKLIKELNSKGFTTKFNVQGDDSLSNGACKMTWHDGGANCSPQALAEQIKALMHHTLAGSDTNRHDKDHSPVEEDAQIVENDSADDKAVSPDEGAKDSVINNENAADDADISGEP